MTPDPKGQVIRNGLGDLDLLLNRTFRAPIDDVWASVTESARTERWIGGWSGEAGVGRTVAFQMTAEEGAPSQDVLIDECEAPKRLVVEFMQGDETWRISLDLTEADSVTTLRFTMRLPEGHDVSDTGPGWEYYLDRLVADRLGESMPGWDDYYPAQKAYYQAAIGAMGQG